MMKIWFQAANKRNPKTFKIKTILITLNTPLIMWLKNRKN